MCSAAGVFTQNKVKGAPVTVSQKNLAKTGGKAKGFILNSKMLTPATLTVRKRLTKCAR